MSELTPLNEAVSALRALQAEHGVAEATEQRVLSTLATRARHRRWAQRSIVGLGLSVFVATGVQAAVYGVDQTLRDVASFLSKQTSSETPSKAERTLGAPAAPPRPDRVAAVPARTSGSVPASTVPQPVADSPLRTDSDLPEQPARRTSASTKRARPPALVGATARSEPDAEALYADAHRLHFVLGNKFDALDAWNRYLAAQPSGGLAPEARYNRSLCLIALGRTQQAMQALSSIAEGADGSYRQKEAVRLLRALSNGQTRD